MGYRLYVTDKRHPNYGEICLGKLFGYAQDEDLKSLEYLIELGKVHEAEVWGDDFDHTIELSTEEYRQFVRLYKKDFREKWGYSMLKDGCFEEIYVSVGPKTLEWG